MIIFIACNHVRFPTGQWLHRAIENANALCQTRPKETALDESFGLSEFRISQHYYSEVDISLTSSNFDLACLS
jgi:hypothetical protein